MAAGKKAHRCVFQRETITPDGGGGGGSAWATQLTVWGWFVPEFGFESLEDGRLEASVTGRLKIRSSSEAQALRENDRVVFDGETYQIRHIMNKDQKDRFLQMFVERGVGQ